MTVVESGMALFMEEEEVEEDTGDQLRYMFENEVRRFGTGLIEDVMVYIEEFDTNTVEDWKQGFHVHKDKVEGLLSPLVAEGEESLWSLVKVQGMIERIEDELTGKMIHWKKRLDKEKLLTKCKAKRDFLVKETTYQLRRGLVLTSWLENFDEKAYEKGVFYVTDGLEKLRKMNPQFKLGM